MEINAELKDDLNTNVYSRSVRNFSRDIDRVACKKYFVNEGNRKKDLQFAKSTLMFLWKYWNRVIFTDESKYNIFESDERCTVWQKEKNIPSMRK